MNLKEQRCILIDIYIYIYIDNILYNYLILKHTDYRLHSLSTQLLMNIIIINVSGFYYKIYTQKNLRSHFNYSK